MIYTQAWLSEGWWQIPEQGWRTTDCGLQGYGVVCLPVSTCLSLSSTDQVLYVYTWTRSLRSLLLLVGHSWTNIHLSSQGYLNVSISIVSSCCIYITILPITLCGHGMVSLMLEECLQTEKGPYAMLMVNIDLFMHSSTPISLLNTYMYQYHHQYRGWHCCHELQ